MHVPFKGENNMASRKFRFVSPGVFLKEIDNSQLPGQAPGIGPVLIGRTRQGPAMKPYKVKSLEEFERVFGSPMPGNEGQDPWREGTDLLAESYLPYAAQAYLSAEIDSPVTVVRLAGVNGENSAAGTDGEAGWKAANAHGLFVFPSASSGDVKLELAAIFYGSTGSFGIQLKGQCLSGSNQQITAQPGEPVLFSPTSNRLSLVLSGSSSRTREVKFLLDEIREDFNTNPVATNDRIMSPAASTLADEYWLGETFEESIRKFQSSITDNTKRAAIVLKLDDEMAEFRSVKHQLSAARTGWVISNDTAMNNKDFNIENQQKLFRLVALQEGFEASKNLLVGIEDIKIPRDGSIGQNLYGSFSVVVKRIYTTTLEEIERFDNCNLNPNSDNYVAKKIGDQYLKWSPTEKRNKLYGTNPNISEFIRVEMDPQIDNVGQGPDNTKSVPFGFYGPIRPFQLTGSATANVVDLQFAGSWTAQNSTKVAPGVGALTASWADFPIVITGSENNNYYFGATPFKRNYSGSLASTTSEEINPGYVDHVRRLPDLDLGVLTTDQEDGVADGHSSEYSFKFSMDEIVLVPSPAALLPTTSSITRESQISAAYYMPGSKLNSTFSAVDKLDTTGIGDLDEFQITVPSQAGGSGNMITVRFFTAAIADPAADIIHVRADDADNARTNLLAAINGGDTTQLKARYGANTGDVTTGILGLTAAAGSSNQKVTLSSTSNDESSADILLTNVQGTVNQADVNFTQNSGISFSAQIAAGSGSASGLRPLTEIVKGFHLPLIGGFDGTNITEANPFNNNVMSEATTETSYAFASVDRAIELIKDSEAIEHNLAAMPGITNTTLTRKLIRACEDRGDSLAIIDLPDVYVPPFEQSCDSFSERLKTTPEKSADALVKRQLNSSYGAAYYPWVKVRDSLNSRDVWVPPSVVALGVMAFTEKQDEVWFAPAGFNRGGLNEGNAGIPVLQVSEQLLSRDRDTLYEANINPIASFVSEGLVVFGQKTLQSERSALDRINVRRLLIYVKKFVSGVCSNLLFEQNVQETWNRFISAVVPELQSIKTRFGLSDFKVVLDETTTTPDLIDRNIMYAKIFLKPARSIEFIAVDFVITNTGAGFNDPPQ